MIKLFGIIFFLIFPAIAVYIFFSKSKHPDKAVRKRRDKRRKIVSVAFIAYLAVMAWFLFFFRSGPIELTKEELFNLVAERVEPPTGQWHYVGTSDGYDYFHYRDQNLFAMGYLVEEGEVELGKRIDGFADEDRWVLMPWGPNNEQ